MMPNCPTLESPMAPSDRTMPKKHRPQTSDSVRSIDSDETLVGGPRPESTLLSQCSPSLSLDAASVGSKTPEGLLAPPSGTSDSPAPGSVSSGGTGRSVSKKASFLQLMDRVRSVSNPTPPDGSKHPKHPKSPSKYMRSISSSFGLHRPPPVVEKAAEQHELTHRRDLPAWDRACDVVYHQYPCNTVGPDKALEFGKSVQLFLKENAKGDEEERREKREKSHGLFSLPPAVRFMVWKELIGVKPREKPIRLSGKVHHKNAWRRDEFATLEEVLAPLIPYMEVCFDFRAEILVTLLMTRRFHVTYSPFVGPLLSPLAINWLPIYAPYMQNLAVELDMTKFSFSATQNAEILPPESGILRMDGRIKELVSSLQRRRGSSTMESLILLCRRYYVQPSNLDNNNNNPKKNRPSEPGLTKPAPKYCPDEFLDICKPFQHVTGLLDSFRICGFSKDYSVTLVHHIFSQPAANNKISWDNCVLVSHSKLYPLLDGQKAAIDSAQGNVLCEEGSAVDEEYGFRPWGAAQLSARAVYKRKAWFERARARTNSISSLWTRRELILEGGPCPRRAVTPGADDLGERAGEMRMRVLSLKRKFSTSSSKSGWGPARRMTREF